MSEKTPYEIECIQRKLDALEKIAKSLELLDDGLPEDGFREFFAQAELGIRRIADGLKKVDELAEEVSGVKLELNRIASILIKLEANSGATATGVEAIGDGISRMTSEIHKFAVPVDCIATSLSRISRGEKGG